MHTSPSATINSQRLARLRERENRAFAARTPRSQALVERARAHLPAGVPMSWMVGLFRPAPIYIAQGDGPRFTDVDGNSYLDFNLCDLSMTIGYGHARLAEVLAAQARRGTHFLLPTEDAIVVAERLAERVGLPAWQFTLSASGANVEVLRVARAMTGRARLVIFGGHYHGHLEETLVRSEDGRAVAEAAGLTPGSAAYTTIVPFNDLAALERTLAAGDVALVLTEPALTNCNLVLPEAGFHDALRELTRRSGSLLCIDEAHTFQFAFGGLTAAWRLDPDFVVLGKGFGSGVAFGLYGMSAAVADYYTRHLDGDSGPRGIATGGTTYGSALALAVARLMLEEVLTPDAYLRLTTLGTRLADGLDATFQAHALPWRAFALGPRSGYCLEPTLPRNGAEAGRSLDLALIDARRVYLANRGIWDAVASAGPQASIAHSEADIDAYLAGVSSFLDELLDRGGTSD